MVYHDNKQHNETQRHNDDDDKEKGWFMDHRQGKQGKHDTQPKKAVNKKVK